MADGEGEEGTEENNNSGVSETEFKKVKNKKDELLDEVKTEREQRKQLEERLANLESELNEKEKEKARKEENIEELEQRLEDEKEQAVSEKKETISELKSELHELKVKNSIKSRINEENVKNGLQDMVEAQLEQRASLQDGEAVVQTEEGEKPLSDYMDDYFEEKGDHVKAAPQNNGGGAGSTGSGGSVNENPLDRSADSFSLSEANNFVRENDVETVKQALQNASNPINVNQQMLEAGT